MAKRVCPTFQSDNLSSLVIDGVSRVKPSKLRGTSTTSRSRSFTPAGAEPFMRPTFASHAFCLPRWLEGQPQALGCYSTRHRPSGRADR